MPHLPYLLVAAGGHETGPGTIDPVTVDKGLFLWFLVAFVIMMVILKKFAWKPILDGLDERESKIRASVDNAERLESELADLDEKRRSTIAEADAKAAEVLESAKRGAEDMARAERKKVGDEVQILKENAYRDIRTAEEKAEAALRQESARVAVELAGKILGENLDDEKNRALTDRLISEL